jgi:phosphopantothenoylcysteine decarboxylase/phosphopantothenate--cysteine ligase
VRPHHGLSVETSDSAKAELLRITPPRRSTVALCVSGSIAAYKAVEVARRLVKSGITVLPVMTASAAGFVGPVTLAGVTGQSVAIDMWDPSFAGEMHVEIARRADVIAIVPATADVLARLASGRADDLVAALVLCARGPVLAAPAMHPRMWDHPATQRNVAELRAQKRITLVGPVEGEVASGEVGMGRMAEPDAIAEAILRHLPDPSFAGERDGDLSGMRIVVTAGPTLEDLDPVRFLGNRSSGKMGFALAERAAARGAEVTLIAGPVALPTPAFVRRIDVRSALSMQAALGLALGSDLAGADALVMAAAVADHRPAEVSPHKIKKGPEAQAIALVRNPDLLAEVGSRRTGKRPVLVGFAVETVAGELVHYARRKLREKGVDFIVANEAESAFGKDDNRATLVDAKTVTPLASMPKAGLADVVLDRVRALWRDGSL